MENITKDIKFNIFTLSNKKSVFGYPYVGISTDTNRVIYISPKEHICISIIHKNDKLDFDSDYTLTDKYFLFDLFFLDDLIESYVGKEYLKKRDYSITAYFNRQKEIVIAYRTIIADIYQEENLSIRTTNKVAKEIITVIFSLLQSIKI